MSEEQIDQPVEEQPKEPERPHFSYIANAKLNLKKFTDKVGGFSLDEVKSQMAESEARKEGETLRVVEISLLSPAFIHWQTVDSSNAVASHTSLIFLDFVNDKAYNSDGSEVSADLGAEVNKILLSAKGRYLSPSVPMDKLEQHLMKSKQVFDPQEVNNV
jgi:hypothetical protein